MWPQGFAPTDQLVLHTTTGPLAVPVCRPVFTAYTAPTDLWTFGHKALVEANGQPMFAELAILRAFEAVGWEGRWVETYGKPRLQPGLWREWKPGGPGAQEHVPIEEPGVNERLHAIAQANGGTYGGSWDVVLWKNGRLLFVESKRYGKDRMRATQGRWLEAALQCGCSVEDFVVEWDLTPPGSTASPTAGTAG